MTNQTPLTKTLLALTTLTALILLLPLVQADVQYCIDDSNCAEGETCEWSPEHGSNICTAEEEEEEELTCGEYCNDVCADTNTLELHECDTSTGTCEAYATQTCDVECVDDVTTDGDAKCLNYEGKSCTRWFFENEGCVGDCRVRYHSCETLQWTTVDLQGAEGYYACVTDDQQDPHTVDSNQGNIVIQNTGENCAESDGPVCGEGEQYNSETGNCDPPGEEFPECGSAEQNYEWPDDSYEGSFCSIGSATPSNPDFPAPESSESWECSNSEGSTTCTATLSCPTGYSPSGDTCVEDENLVRVRSWVDGTAVSGATITQEYGDAPSSGMGGTTGEDGTGYYDRTSTNTISNVRLQAPSTHNGADFERWDNCNSDSNRDCWISLSGYTSRTVTAHYQTADEPPSPACGSAEQTYAWDDDAYEGSFCSIGSATPSNPDFPIPDSSESWECSNSAGSTTCTAARQECPTGTSWDGSTCADDPIEPVCGNYNDDPCAVGTLSDYTSGLQCGDTSWTCTNDGIETTCEEELTCSTGQDCYNNMCYDPLQITSFTATPNEHQAPFTSNLAFTVEGGVGGVTYQVDYGNGATSAQFGPAATTFSDTLQATYNDVQTYTAEVTAQDEAGNTATRTLQITGTNYNPIVTLESSPEQGPAQLDKTYTLTIQDASPEVTYTLTLSNGQTITETLSNPNYNQNYTYTEVVEHTITYPTVDYDDACADPGPYPHTASVEVTDYFGATGSDDTTNYVHPIEGQHPDDADLTDARGQCDCEEDAQYFDGACYQTGTLNAQVLLDQADGSTTLAWGSTIEIGHTTLPIVESLQANNEGRFSLTDYIVGEWDLTATFQETWSNTVREEIRHNEERDIEIRLQEIAYSADCTNAQGFCDREAAGKNGCLMPDDYSAEELEARTAVLEACHPPNRRGREPGHLVYLDSNETHTQTARCCAEAPEWHETRYAEVDGDVEALIVNKRPVTYLGQQVNLVVVTWY